MLRLNMLAKGLYAIVDVELTRRAGFEVLAFAEALLAARPSAIQLRAKSIGAREHLRLLEGIVRRAESTGIPVYANDRPDLALLAGCAGVHVGQSDVPVSDVRRLGAKLSIGLSTATEEQLREGLMLKPDYIAVGPIYVTASKADADPAVGLEFLANAARSTQALQIPIVAIGGIDHARAGAVGAIGAIGAAISAMIPSNGRLQSATELARSLHEALGGA